MLTKQQILTASFNDILFQDRNQGYGAYALRKEYNNHMKVAIGAMVGICLASFTFYFSGSLSANADAQKLKYLPDPVALIKPPAVPQIPLPPVPPKPPIVPKSFRSEIFTPPVIVKGEVSKDEMPPEQTDLEMAVIGVVKSSGEDIGNIVAPPVESRTAGDVIAPKVKEESDTKTWTKVENPAEFPGGAKEWARYLQKNLRYPDLAIENGNQAVVRVQFVVDKEGNISDVQALNDPGDGLAEEAVRIIKKGPKWLPAEQNGKKVIYRHIQAITFRLEGF